MSIRLAIYRTSTAAASVAISACFVFGPSDKPDPTAGPDDCKECDDSAKCYIQTGTKPTDYVFDCASYACADTSHLSGPAPYVAFSTVFEFDYASFGSLGSTADVDAMFLTAAADWNTLPPAVDIVSRTVGCSPMGSGATDQAGFYDNSHQCIALGGSDPEGGGSFAGTVCTSHSNNICYHATQSCDIVLFSTYGPKNKPSSWTLSPIASAGQLSVPAVLAHELGHPLGLGDQLWTETPSTPYYDSIMAGPLSASFMETNGWSFSIHPSDDDRAALVWIYGREPGGG